MGHSAPDGQIQQNNSFSQTGRIKSSGPFCTWIRVFGLFGVLLAKYGVLILSHKLGNPRRSGHCALKHGFWSFRSIARQMRRNNLSRHKLGESSRMGHSAPEHGCFWLSESSGQLWQNKFFSQTGRIKANQGVVLLAKFGEITLSRKLGELSRVGHSVHERYFLGFLESCWPNKAK